MRSGAMVLGGGLAGLSAAYGLTRSGRETLLVEADTCVGGLSKTLVSGGFRYDIGGHRFHTRDAGIESLVRGLMGAELVEVNRSSKIFMRGRYFDYPLRPANAVMSLGPLTIASIILDYAFHRASAALSPKECVSLEDWVVGRFGRKLFELYFKEYSEKVWGVECGRISRSWVAKRIQGLSLITAIRSAFFKFAGRDIPTLTDRFLYPSLGIGRLPDRIAEEITASSGSILTGAPVERITHDGRRISSIAVKNLTVEAGHYVSTIPLPSLVRMLTPEAPAHVREAAACLGFRDLVIVAAEVDKETVTDQSWIYIPESKYVFGRIHEPKVWSPAMAPEGKTLVVVEFFCFRDDDVWRSSDDELSRITARGLADLGFIRESEVVRTTVHRVPNAYPLFTVGYEDHCKVLTDYLARFENLTLAGRSGMFEYQNMDHAMSSGLAAASAASEKLAAIVRAA